MRWTIQGSGVAYIMRAQAEKEISRPELEEFNKVDGNPYLSSVEELYYYRGLAHQATNQPGAAAEDYQAALAYNPKFELAAQALGELKSTN